MNFSLRRELPSLLLIVAMFGIAAWAWPRVPERIPIHWNLQGQADGWGSKLAGLLVLPLTALGVYGMMLLVGFVDPGKINYANFAKAFAVIRFSFVCLMAIMFVATVFAAFGFVFNMTPIIMVAVGALFLVFGNYMSKIRPNWFLGVRTPWTLSSRLSWDKTHRLAGWLFLVMAVMCFVVAARQNVWTFAAMITVDGLCIVWLFVYSYLVYLSDPHRTGPAGVSPISEDGPA
jgi:uncharacterized membrane protein